MNTANQPITPAPAARRASPMRVIRRWLFGERALRGPAAIELDVLDRQVTREENALRHATAEAETLTGQLAGTRTELASALANDGIVDAQEAASLARHLMDTSIAANAHRQTLEALT